VLIKVNTPKSNQLLYILLPGLIVIIILVIYFHQSRRYKKRKEELKRTEKLIFDMDSRESILKTRHTLRERLRFLSKSPTEKE
jgi:hypothetical protein